MPAVSRKQQVAMAIAEHTPEKLHAENKGMLQMSHSQLHDFAATKRSDLPERAPKKAKRASLADRVLAKKYGKKI